MIIKTQSGFQIEFSTDVQSYGYNLNILEDNTEKTTQIKLSPEEASWLLLSMQREKTI